MIKRIAFLTGLAMMFGLGYFFGGYHPMDSIRPDAYAGNWYNDTITCPQYSIFCAEDMGWKYLKITLEGATITSVEQTGTGARVYYKTD